MWNMHQTRGRRRSRSPPRDDLELRGPSVSDAPPPVGLSRASSAAVVASRGLPGSAPAATTSSQQPAALLHDLAALTNQSRLAGAANVGNVYALARHASTWRGAIAKPGAQARFRHTKHTAMLQAVQKELSEQASAGAWHDVPCHVHCVWM